VNVLDENIPRDQADLLRQAGIRFRSISRDLGYQGISDEDIVPLLLRLKQPTLLTRDEDFHARRLAHPRYALVWLDVEVEETAFFIVRFLSHPLFRTKAQRLGKVLRVHPQGIDCWSKHSGGTAHVAWS
jgi:predicted nuclease of predicted toxin-antitoxin system